MTKVLSWGSIDSSKYDVVSVGSSQDMTLLSLQLRAEGSEKGKGESQKNTQKKKNAGGGQHSGEISDPTGSHVSTSSSRIPFSWAEITKIQPTFQRRPFYVNEAHHKKHLKGKAKVVKSDPNILVVKSDMSVLEVSPTLYDNTVKDARSPKKR